MEGQGRGTCRAIVRGGAGGAVGNGKVRKGKCEEFKAVLVSGSCQIPEMFHWRHCTNTY